jgi:hypothetical protein
VNDDFSTREYRDLRDADETPKDTNPKQWDHSFTPVDYSTTGSGVDTTVGGFDAAQGDSAIAVDGRALVWYADNLARLKTPITTARTRLQGVALAPGRFKASAALLAKLEGDSGVVHTFDEALRLLLPAVTDLESALRELAKQYDTAEELSSEAGRTALGTALDDFDHTSTGKPAS